MNYLNKYQELAGRTDKKDREYNYFFLQLICESGELLNIHVKNKYHNHPLDLINLKEEIGDIYWFVSRLAHRVEEKLSNVCHSAETSMGPMDLFDVLAREAITDQDIYLSINRHAQSLIPYIRDDNNFSCMEKVEILKILIRIVGCINYLIERNDLNLENILELNIEKLKVRYPDTYSDYHSLNRDTKKELRSF